MADQSARWLNPANYKKARLKQHDLWVCMPKVGVWTYNRLLNPVLYRQLNGRMYISEGEIRKDGEAGRLRTLRTLGHEFECSGGYCTVVCSGLRGELFTLPLHIFTQYFAFVQGDKLIPIDKKALDARLESWGMDWQRVRVIKSPPFWACFVPEQETGTLPPYNSLINARTVSHGKGDFVIVPSYNDVPSIDSIGSVARVINGEVFANMCNLRGWKDCVVDKQHKSKKPDYSLCVNAGSIQQFLTACSAMVHVPCFVENSFKAEGGGLQCALEGYLRKCWANTGRPLTHLYKVYADARADILSAVERMLVNKGVCKTGEVSVMRCEPWKADMEAKPPVQLIKDTGCWHIVMLDLYKISIKGKVFHFSFVDTLVTDPNNTALEGVVGCRIGNIDNMHTVSSDELGGCLETSISSITGLVTTSRKLFKTGMTGFMSWDANRLFDLFKKQISE